MWEEENVICGLGPLENDVLSFNESLVLDRGSARVIVYAGVSIRELMRGLSLLRTVLTS